MDGPSIAVIITVAITAVFLIFVLFSGHPSK
jgi:hypothetical protein